MNYWQQQNGNGSQLDPMNAWSQQAQPDAVTAPATQTQTLNPGTGNAFQRMLEKVQAAKAPATQTLNPGDAFRGDQGASDLLGKISRAQWEDWRGRFAPYISTLADMLLTQALRVMPPGWPRSQWAPRSIRPARASICSARAWASRYQSSSVSLRTGARTWLERRRW